MEAANVQANILMLAAHKCMGPFRVDDWVEEAPKSRLLIANLIIYGL